MVYRRGVSPILAVLLVGAVPVPECPGAPDKPAALRCYEAGDRATAWQAARAELRREDATPDDRRFAAELAAVVAQEMYEVEHDPGRLCAIVEVLEEYLGLPGAVVAAGVRRDAAAAALEKNHPDHRCTHEPAEDTAANTGPQRASEGPRVLPPVLLRPVPVRRTTSARTIAGSALLVVAAGLGAGAAGLAVVRDGLRERTRGLRDDVLDTGGWTPALEQRREHLLEVDRRTYGTTLGLAVSSGVLAALGVGLVVAGERGERRAELVPQGGAHGAGVLLQGRF